MFKLSLKVNWNHSTLIGWENIAEAPKSFSSPSQQKKSAESSDIVTIATLLSFLKEAILVWSVSRTPFS